jgi:hypothetical protein
MTRILSAMKSFLYYDSYSQFDSFARGGDTDGIKVFFVGDV